MNTMHTLDCWAAAYRAALENGADSVAAFDWAAYWLTESGDKDCECVAGHNLLSRRDFAFSRS